MKTQWIFQLQYQIILINELDPGSYLHLLFRDSWYKIYTNNIPVNVYYNKV